MTVRASTVKLPYVTASVMRDTIADALAKVRVEDKLTFDDLGEILGKSRDAVTRYCDGTATMDVVTYYRAKQVFNGRFTRAADALIGHGAHDETSDRDKESTVLKAALALSIALGDGNISKAEILQNRKTLEAARDSIDALLCQIAPKAVA